MATRAGPTADLAVVDLSRNDREVANELLLAASTFGFVYVKNNEAGIMPADLTEIFQMSRKFFKSPTLEKEECSVHSSKSGKNQGWLSMHTENLDPEKQKRGDFKEAFNIGEYVAGRAQQPLPEQLAICELEIGNFMGRCHSICNRILQLIAEALEIPEDQGGKEWFSSRHDQSQGPSGSILRLLYYPAITASSGYDAVADIRAGAHSDYGSITLLFQLPGQPGLEILDQDGKWTPVSINPTGESFPPILVNIGDLLSFWTKSLLKSTVHRVVVPQDENGRAVDRFSIAYFCHPIDDAQLVPVPSKAVRDIGGLHKVGYGGGARHNSDNVVLTARDHLNRRLAATYGLNE